MSLCRAFSFDHVARESRLALLELIPNDHSMAQRLQDVVIKPNIEPIIEGFYELLLRQPKFLEIVSSDEMRAHLRTTQSDYLLTLGLNFDSPAYFEERLRIGVIHARVGVPLSLYQCAYRALQQLLIDHTHSCAPDEYHALVGFILKITTLDMSLAIETYHTTQVRALEESVQSLHDRSVVLQRQAEIDEGTGLANRKYILEVSQRALSMAQRERTSLCLIIADLDWFKRVNDNYGHLVGDQVLRDIAARIHSVIREFDSVGRYGGEEFLIVMANKTEPAVRKIAERILRRVEDEPVHYGAFEIPVTISLGVAFARSGDTLTALIERSDKALYKAKNAGRNQIVFAS